MATDNSRLRDVVFLIQNGTVEMPKKCVSLGRMELKKTGRSEKEEVNKKLDSNPQLCNQKCKEKMGAKAIE
jgi:hypothetical protein